MGNKKKIFNENDFDKEKKFFSSEDFEKNKDEDKQSKPSTSGTRSKPSNNRIKKVAGGITIIAIVCLLGHGANYLFTHSNKDDVITIEQVRNNKNADNGEGTSSPIQKETVTKTPTPKTEQNQDSRPNSVEQTKQSSKPAIKADEPLVITERSLNNSGTLEQKAKEVIRGNYGNGIERKQKLGEQYTEIQGKVNEMYKKGLVD